MGDVIELFLQLIFSYMFWVGVVITLLIYFVFFTDMFSSKSKSKAVFSSRHIMVTGGSSGIGKSVAIEAARRGANVTIIARDPTKLKSAKEEIIKACTTPLQRINAFSFDVSDNYDELQKTLLDVEDEVGPIFMLVNCAGSSVCGKMEDLSVTDFKYMNNLNYMGSVLPTKAVISGMKTRGCGYIVFTASQAAMLGIFGYTAYCSSKFALRGLAEALYMEAKPYGVRVMVALPPDTDTPGFAEEEKGKLMETRQICQSSGLISPNDVATKILDDAIAGKFYSSVGFEGFIQKTLCAGMAPATSFTDLINQVLLMGVMRLVSIFYLLHFEAIVRNCMKSRDLAKKAE